MGQERLDLDAASREALEFDALLGWVAGAARTVPGRERLLGAAPWAEATALGLELDALREATALLDLGETLVPWGIPDPAPALETLAAGGSRLEAAALRGVALVARAGGELAVLLGGLDAVRWPRLRAAGGTIPNLGREAATVLRAVEPDGRIQDDASPELRELRAQRRRASERLRRQLLGLLREPDNEPVVRDDFVTERNGRWVIPVRADAPRAIRGIVHATSSSGATQFVEPLETVEANNEIVRLGEREQREIERLLGIFSDSFRARLTELRGLVGVLGWIDSLQARALYAREIDGTLPQIGSGGGLLLREARHPLLERRLRATGRACVPIDIGLEPADRVLVLSGPNAGGKTVALKTIGVAVLAGQSAIPFPAAELRLPLYRQVRADIGDRQSIAADLSTFTAHVRAVAEFLGGAAPPALLLFDEIGSGTEPREGAALALAILERLRQPGLTAVATTHQAELKTWALGTPGAASAALEFDTRALQPTYRVRMDEAGVSAGLEIALRAGLDPALVERARANLGSAARRSEELLGRLRARAAELEERARQLERRTAELEAERVGLVEAAARDEAERRDAAARALDRALETFTAASRKALAELEARGESRAAARAASRATARVRAEHARLREQLGPAPADGYAPAAELAEGQLVRIRSLGRDGRVVRVRAQQVEVLLGRVSFTVARDDVWVRVREAGGRVDPERPSPDARTPLRGAPGAEPESPAAELILIGRTVEEALTELDRYLDAAVLAGLGEVRVVHGHGTGRLRRAVREFLDGHALVSAHRPGGAHEGGDGATVVRLG